MYDGGVVLKLNPGGLKLVVRLPLRIELATLQLLASGSLYLETPAGAVAVMVELPHDNVTFAGETSWTTAQR